MNQEEVMTKLSGTATIRQTVKLGKTRWWHHGHSFRRVYPYRWVIVSKAGDLKLRVVEYDQNYNVALAKIEEERLRHQHKLKNQLQGPAPRKFVKHYTETIQLEDS